MDLFAPTRRVFLSLFAASLPLFCGVPDAGELDRWMERALREFRVPGAALGIVKDGKLVFARGYGVRRQGESGRVDEHTIFGIASNTKAFTAAALGILATEGKLSFDDPVQKHLPSFQLHDPWATREIRVRDLLCHRSGLGLGAGDLLFWPDTDFRRSDVVAAARFLRPASSFRSTYAYNNLMFVVAGEVVAAVSGMPVDEFLRRRIFAPLEMKESQVTSLGLRAGGNVATPHSAGWRQTGEVRPIRPTKDDTWAAAAGVKSNILDLSRWVVAQLAQGVSADGRRLWSEAVAREMWSAQTPVPIRTPPPGLEAIQPQFQAYGLGWSLREYRGRKVVSHGGALTGMVTSVVMVPQERLGVIVLSNQESNGMLQAVGYHVLDAYLDAPRTDWIGQFHQAHQATLARAAAAEEELERERARDSRSSLTLSRYAGSYLDAWYGRAAIQLENEKLVLRMTHTPAMVADLSHWQHDSFKARWRDPDVPDAFVTFTLDFHGRIAGMKMQAVSELADFSFDYHDLDFRPVEEKETRK